eukprot:g33805.t1
MIVLGQAHRDRRTGPTRPTGPDMQGQEEEEDKAAAAEDAPEQKPRHADYHANTEAEEAREGTSSKEKKVDVKKCSIPDTEEVDGVVYFFINVESSKKAWSVKKRYSQFEDLHSSLQASPLARKIPHGVGLPPKRIWLFVNHTSPAFIEERRVLLESFLYRLVKVPEIARSELFINFLTSDMQSKRAEVKRITALPDDVEITHIEVPSTRTMSDHVLYQVDVSNERKPKTYSKWTVLKRFNQFYEMDVAVRAAFEGKEDILAKLPPPPERQFRLFTDHLHDVFIQQRRVLLENYLQRMAQVEEVVRNKDFLQFLGVNV